MNGIYVILTIMVLVATPAAFRHAVSAYEGRWHLFAIGLALYAVACVVARLAVQSRRKSLDDDTQSISAVVNYMGTLSIRPVLGIAVMIASFAFAAPAIFRGGFIDMLAGLLIAALGFRIAFYVGGNEG